MKTVKLLRGERVGNIIFMDYTGLVSVAGHISQGKSTVITARRHFLFY